MSKEKTFVDGMIVKRRDNAPDWVKANLSIKVAELVAFLQQYEKNGWVNIDIKQSGNSGKLYAELDTWEPTQGQAAEKGMAAAQKAADIDDDDIPF